jgi:hypothetical protein
MASSTGHQGAMHPSSPNDPERIAVLWAQRFPLSHAWCFVDNLFLNNFNNSSGGTGA